MRAATAHDLLTVRGSVENYDAQILCMGQNVIAAPAAWALIDIWLDLRHDPTSSYGPKVGEIAAYEAATWMSALGCDVTMLVRGPRLLSAAESFASRLIEEALTARGVTVMTDARVTAAERSQAQ